MLQYTVPYNTILSYAIPYYYTTTILYYTILDHTILHHDNTILY